jgi:predicted GNAT family acetyltransferase
MKPKRLWMAIETKQNSNLALDSDLTIVSNEATSALARLMDVSYRGTIDYEGETLEQCEAEIRGTIEGKYGQFLSEASFCVLTDDKIVSACLITLWKNQPLIAFSMTDPEFQGQGLAKKLILNSMNVLAHNAYKVLYLVVTNGNTAAQNLYRKIGFKDLGEALPGEPPPPTNLEK